MEENIYDVFVHMTARVCQATKLKQQGRLNFCTNIIHLNALFLGAVFPFAARRRQTHRVSEDYK